jgi:signal transduction histidine kinase
LTNGIKHAHASQLDLRILGVHPVLILAYSDDGIGFDIEQVTTGVGLRSIQQRVELLGGSIRQRASKPHGTGTAVRIELPLRDGEGQIT